MTEFVLTLAHRLLDCDDFAIWYKPAGVGMHSEQHEGIVVLASRLAGGEYWPVHRLDQGTSGLLILAKSAAAAARFGEMFAAHQVQKYYVAVAIGKPKQKQGWVKGDMASARGGNYKLLTSQTNPAVSYVMSQALQADDLPSGCRAYLIKPWTGKTHQIRVALKSLAVPIAGDERYGGAATDRLHLHAFALQFTYLGQVFDLSVLPQQGQWLLHPALLNLLSTTWATPAAVDWPRYQKPRSESDGATR